MIVDLARAPAGDAVDCDVCVAGGGVAGLAIALKLASLGRRVVVLEAGGRSRSADSQAVYRGENAGVENLPLHETRLRMFGGSSNHWGGWCRPFDAYDFDRTDLTGDAWPISLADIAPFLDEAAGILGITEFSGSDLPLTGADGNLQTIRMFFSAPPVQIGERFADVIAESRNLTLFLNAAVTDLRLAPAGKQVESMVVRGPRNAAGFTCRARLFVLALGTVENTRMLLAWNRTNGNRIANPAFLGRYYMQHLHHTLGEFVLFDTAQALTPPGARPTTFFTSTERMLRSAGSGAFRVYSSAISCERLIDKLTGVASATLCSSITVGGSLSITCEQLPNPDSRLTLLSAVDEFGIPRVRMDWQINAGDARTLNAAAMEFGRYLVRANAGRLKIRQPVIDQKAPLTGWSSLPSAPGAAGHQMGGIRMSRRPEDGVTDPDCRLWGLDNFYIGGAGVFRTSSHANPTLTLTQLALRLAGKLNEKLGKV